MNVKIATEFGVLHAHVLPTMDTIGDQPWMVWLRSPAGDLLLYCYVDETSAKEAVGTAVQTFLEAKKASNKNYRFV